MITNSQLNTILSVAGALLFLFSTTVFAGDRIMTGQWEFAMTTDGATRTISQCITAEKAAEVNADSKSGRAQAEKDANGRCTVDAYDAAGDKVGYTLTCGGRVIKSMTTYHGDSSDGSLVTVADGKTTTTGVKAKRLGPCR